MLYVFKNTRLLDFDTSRLVGQRGEEGSEGRVSGPRAGSEVTSWSCCSPASFLPRGRARGSDLLPA